MHDIIPFRFEGSAFRVVQWDHTPWFVLADVCRVLDVANSRDAATRLDDDEKGVGIVDTLGGAQEMAIINESGLYGLILTSRKPSAKRFKKWVTTEVLPSIRRTGGYTTSGNAVPDAVAVLRDLLTEQIARNHELEQRFQSACQEVIRGELCISEMQHAMIGLQWRADLADQRAQKAEMAVEALRATINTSLATVGRRATRYVSAWPTLRQYLSQGEFRALRARTVCDLTGCPMSVAYQVVSDLVHAGVIERDDGRLGGRTFRLTGRDLPTTN